MRDHPSPLQVDHRAFTLVEMLVTLAIIGVIVALVIPALSGAIEQGRKIKCKANLRSIGQAMIMYMDDGDGLVPVATKRADVRSGYLKPFDTLGASMGVPMPRWDTAAGEAALVDAWVCPSDRQVAATVGFSYQYMPWAYFSLLGPDERRLVTRELTQNHYSVFEDYVPHGDDKLNFIDIDGTVRELIGRERR